MKDADSKAERDSIVHHDFKGRFAIRDEVWQFYDLGSDSDCSEMNDLSASTPELLQQLLKE
ncbi:hypothetical protein P4B35_01455 [Pontiellaceae bacterium B12227]|nr:hypothetical protein [Pontiellaceae bacterium B12227]